MHVVPPATASVSVTAPAPHASQAGACVPEYLPGSQLTHAELALSLAARLVPAAQLLHALFPLTSWYLPTSHGLQPLS